MKINELKKDLEWRGLLKDIANEESLAKTVENSGKFYIGIDPTADSIHLGHFLALSLSKILNNHGLKPVFVIGGFTGMIGDPSGRNSEREVIDREVTKNNVKKIEEQIKTIAEKMGFNGFETFDNSIVYEKMSIIDLYQIYGKLFNINNMLNKESVQNRLENGISYTEFSYQMFQAIDFNYLFEHEGVSLQLGGSDQWGNIVAGIDLIRKIHGADKDASGITINLLTDENGNKVGKSHGTPMWLNKEKTSPYALHQYFINLTDNVADKLLKQATDINIEDYEDVKAIEAKLRPLQNELSKRFISEVHSEQDYNNALEISKLLFEERYNDLTTEQVEGLVGVPSVKNEDKTIMDLLIDAGFCPSRREFRDLLSNGAIKVNGNPINNEEFKLTNEFIKEKVAFVNLGKKNKYIIWK